MLDLNDAVEAGRRHVVVLQDEAGQDVLAEIAGWYVMQFFIGLLPSPAEKGGQGRVVMPQIFIRQLSFPGWLRNTAER